MFRPMKAPQEIPSTFPKFFDFVQYPVIGSPKLDGIRGLILEGTALSVKLKPLPSIQIQSEFVHDPDLDGEFIEGKPNEQETYNRTQSHVMSANKPGDIKLYVFDTLNDVYIEKPYIERLEYISSLTFKNPKVVIHDYRIINNYDELIAYEDECLDGEFEGLMLRSFGGPYKFGRATMRERNIFKLKRFTDAEGVVVGFEERMTNNNPLETNELGLAKRSSSKANKVPAGTLGKFIILYAGKELPVSTGKFKHDECQYIWDNRELFKGKSLKFKFFSRGMKDLPRQPTALGWRDERI